MNNSQLSLGTRRIFIAGISLLIGFSAIAKGAHDLWAATVVYLSLMLLFVAFVAVSNFQDVEFRLPLVKPTLVMVAALAVSFWRSTNPSESFLSFMDWMSLLMILILSVNIIHTVADVKLLLALLVPIFLTEYVVTFGQWLYNSYLVRHSLRAYEEPVGTFINGNSTVAFSLLWIPYLIEQSLSSSKPNEKTRWYWGCGLLALGLVLAMVASTWSVVCLCGGVLVSVGKNRLLNLYSAHKILFITLLLLCSATMLALIWYKLALIHGWSGIQPKRHLPTSRINWWISGLKMWRDYPWFGVGIGNFPSAYLAYKTGTGFNTLYAHSFLVQLLAETGTYGFLAIGFFFFSCFKSGWSNFFGVHRSLSAGLAMFLLYSAIHVSFEYLSHLLALGLVLGILLAQVKEGWIWKPQLSLTFLTVGAVVCALTYIVSPFFASRLIVDGQVALTEKKWEDAEKSFSSAEELDPRGWEPYDGLAQIAVARGNISQAIIFQQQAVDRNQLNLKLREELDFLVKSLH